MSTPRKICYVITNRIHYGRCRTLLEALKAHPDIILQIVVAGSAVLPKYGDVLTALQQDGFSADAVLFTSIEGGNHISMAKSTGLSTIEFSSTFQNLKPDIVILRGDRFEVLAGAIAASYLNIPIAHIEGGDVSGTLDESVRHAITKLSHIHFPTNEKSADRLRAMGERPDMIFNVGSLDIEFVESVKQLPLDPTEALHLTGTGIKIDLQKPFLMVLQHPVTTEIEADRQAMETFEAVRAINLPTIWFWPNPDAGTEKFSKVLRHQHETKPDLLIRFIRHLSPEIFIRLLQQTKVLIGNSSAGIKEASYLGVPTVQIGSRQNQRFSAGYHAILTDYERNEIKQAIEKQLQAERPTPNLYYYRPDSSKRMVEILRTSPLYTQKKFYEGTA